MADATALEAAHAAKGLFPVAGFQVAPVYPWSDPNAPTFRGRPFKVTSFGTEDYGEY